MKIVISLLFCWTLCTPANAQTIDKAMLAKYSQRAEQEKIIDRQILLLKMSPQQAAQFKAVSFYYIDKALVVVNANINSGIYTLYRKMKPIKAEHEAAMKILLTAPQLDAWNMERKKNGIVAQIVK